MKGIHSAVDSNHLPTSYLSILSTLVATAARVPQMAVEQTVRLLIGSILRRPGRYTLD